MSESPDTDLTKDSSHPVGGIQIVVVGGGAAGFFAAIAAAEANPKANVRNHGFTVEERSGFTRLMEAGFVDTFRDRHPGQGGHYTWWSPMAGARSRNVGWRIDYCGISGTLRPALKEAFIRPSVRGSDHCPVGLVLG